MKRVIIEKVGQPPHREIVEDGWRLNDHVRLGVLLMPTTSWLLAEISVRIEEN